MARPFMSLDDAEFHDGEKSEGPLP